MKEIIIISATIIALFIFTSGPDIKIGKDPHFRLNDWQNGAAMTILWIGLIWYGINKNLKGRAEGRDEVIEMLRETKSHTE